MDADSTTSATRYDPQIGAQAAAKLSALYVGAIAALLLLRFEAVRWGFLLTSPERSALRIAVIVHVALLAGAIALVLAMRRPRESGRRAYRWLGLVFPFCALLSCDVLAGVMAPFEQQVPAAAFRADDELGWTVEPMWHGRIHGVDTQVNEMGLRGDSPMDIAPTGTKRLLCLGDSIAFGYGVKEGEEFVSLLPSTLADAGCATPVQTLNFGVPGYAPWQQLVQLREIGLAYKPDAVVHSICLNDFVARHYFDQVMGQMRQPPTLAARAAEWSGLYRLGRAWLTERQREFTDIAYARTLIDGPGDRPELQRACNAALSDLRAIIRLVRENGIRFAIVCFPMRSQVGSAAEDSAKADPTAESAWPQRKLAELCVAEDVPYLDLLPAFQEWQPSGADDSEKLFLDVYHPTPIGHRFSAEQIARFLIDQALIPCDDGSVP